MEIDEIGESLSFTCLPNHIWEKIFGYSENLMDLMLTCKYFNDLISKSPEVMSLTELVLEDSKYNNQENIAAILTSERKISYVRLQNVSAFGYNFFKILDQFKKYIKNITFSNNVHLSPIVLIDLFEMLQNLEELVIDSSNHLISHQPVTVVFKKGRKLKKVKIGDAKILQYLPEIENLECETHSEDSIRELNKYLETHNQLKKLEVSQRSADNFPFTSLGYIHFKLDSLTLDGYPSNSLLNNRAINFIKSQAKSLKQLKLYEYIYNLEIIQDLFDGMDELTYVEIWGDMRTQRTEFVDRYFKCPKIKELRLMVFDLDYTGLFKKFPKLERLHIWQDISASMVDSAAQNCRNLSEISIWTFDESFQNVTFPELINLEIYYLKEGLLRSISIFEDFLSRHQKLKIINLNFTVEKETLWKLPALLPNLDNFEFCSFEGFNEDDLKKLLSSWESIKKLGFQTEDQRELDLEGATRDIARRLIVRQQTKESDYIFSK